MPHCEKTGSITSFTKLNVPSTRYVCMYVFIKLHITTQSGPVILVCMYVCMYVLCFMYSHTYSKGMDQPGKVANPARGQLNREN